MKLEAYIHWVLKLSINFSISAFLNAAREGWDTDRFSLNDISSQNSPRLLSTSMARFARAWTVCITLFIQSRRPKVQKIKPYSLLVWSKLYPWGDNVRNSDVEFKRINFTVSFVLFSQLKRNLITRLCNSLSKYTLNLSAMTNLLWVL
jgi:hypothetical protein